MSDKTGIEWTDATWNPVTGCSKVSAGCKHCYAEREWPRMTRLVPAYAGREFTDVRTHADRLDQPLRWKKPRMIFVNSMSDLFHPDVPFEFIERVFETMASAHWHVFQILTKRADRMREFMRDMPMTLPNVWLGVSVEDQEAADERIPLLLDTPAAVRWISAEPLLGPVRLSGLFGLITDDEDVRIDALNGTFITSRYQEEPTPLGARIDWVVVGGESGPNARPMHPQWARDLRDQCAQAGVPFLFKQWGEWFPTSIGQGGSQLGAWNGNQFMPGWGDIESPENNMVMAGKRAFGGRLLDGVQHDGYPEGGAA